jgi:ribosomal protein L16 Arg81 hydroxylase
VPPHHVDIYSGSSLMKLSDMQDKSGRTGTSLVAEHLRQGATIRVRELQMFDAGVATLMSEVQRLFDARSQINLYLTPPSAAGFPPHFDITDVFIVQCSGTKSWTVFEQYADHKLLPLPETPWEPTRYTPQGSGTTMTLSAGDVLYLPRGTMHGAACLRQASLHLTISLTPLTVADVMVGEVKRFAEGNVELRERAAWSEDGGAAAITEQLRRQFLALASAADASAVVDAERRVIHGDGENDASAGALVSCLQELEGQ